MKKTKNCKHCALEFVPRRANHTYCSQSCKTLANYKRNNYNYISGHYQKPQIIIPETKIVPVANEIKTAITSLEERVNNINQVNVTSITNAAIGSLAASTAINGAKRLFAPNSLPATKGDIDELKKDIDKLKNYFKYGIP